MKLSTTTAIARSRPDGPKLSMEQSAKWIREAGFDAVDANFFFSPNEANTPLLRDDWEAWANTVREQYAALDLPFDQAHAPAYNLSAAGKGMDARTDLLMRRSFAVSSILGARWIVVHPVTVPGAVSVSVSREASIEYFRPWLDLAAEHGLSIAIENMFDTFNYVGDHAYATEPRASRTDNIIRFRRRYCSELDELISLVDALHATHPNVCICWDTGHGNEMGIPQVEALKAVGGRLKALHINDNYAIYDDHNIPFHGTIDCWPEIMAALKHIGYDGYLTFETGKFSKHVPTPLLGATLSYSAAVGRYLSELYERA